MRKIFFFVASFALLVVKQVYPQVLITSPQRISKVWVQDDVGSSGPMIYFSTSDNNGMWNIMGAGGCTNQPSLLIPSASYSKREWLSVLLSAQATGAKVEVQFNACGTAPYSIKAISIQN
ncbi:MAG TPA: hypothetical protein VJ385_21595 [Fibrobacteria bacterium]|nr:hypothetical protein [Fibrobacteria bacterium]